jgi:hypothetical protein
MLRHKRLNEVIAIDTYFSSVKSIEGYYFAQVFFGMTSKMLYFYSGVVQMDTDRTECFLGELYGLSCCACDIGNSFCMERPRRRLTSLLDQTLVQPDVGRI